MELFMFTSKEKKEQKKLLPCAVHKDEASLEGFYRWLSQKMFF